MEKSDTIYLTREGRQKIEDELHRLKYTSRPASQKAIAVAREKGDLSENAEYTAAKEVQQQLERRIAELQNQLTRAVPVEDMGWPEGEIHIGCYVELEDLDTGHQLSWTLVSHAEANSAERKISASSPIGEGLAGHKEGQEVEIVVPAGTKRFKILKVERR